MHITRPRGSLAGEPLSTAATSRRSNMTNAPDNPQIGRPGQLPVCPRCHGGDVFRAPIHWYDLPAAAVLLRPFHCSDCGRRFYRLARGSMTMAASSSAPSERRASLRFPANLEVVWDDQIGERIKLRLAWARDLSRGGVRLETARAFAPGAGLFVRFLSRNGAASLTVEARVVHCRAHEAARWLVGCCFTTKLSEAIVRSLLEQF
jgi:hypothetical protein